MSSAESQRKIVLGKGRADHQGDRRRCTPEIADMVEGPVHLFLFVKVRERWGEDPETLPRMGLEFPGD